LLEQDAAFVWKTVVVTDVKNSTLTTAQSGHDATLRINEDLGEFARLCREYGGIVGRDRGDGLQLIFDDPYSAVSAAIAMQRLAMTTNATRPRGGVTVLHRFGVHMGQVELVRAPDGKSFKYTGPTVQWAARLESKCVPGEVAFSAEVYRQIKDRVSFPILDCDQRRFKGVPQAIHMYSTRLDPSTRKPPDDDVVEAERRARELALAAEAALRQREEKETGLRLRKRTVVLMAVGVVGAVGYYVSQQPGNQIRPTVERLRRAWESASTTEPRPKREPQAIRTEPAKIEPRANTGKAETAPVVKRPIDEADPMQSIQVCSRNTDRLGVNGCTLVTRSFRRSKMPSAFCDGQHVAKRWVRMCAESGGRPGENCPVQTLYMIPEPGSDVPCTLTHGAQEDEPQVEPNDTGSDERPGM
jgi:class 3 adenylate cyclase